MKSSHVSIYTILSPLFSGLLKCIRKANTNLHGLKDITNHSRHTCQTATFRYYDENRKKLRLHTFIAEGGAGEGAGRG